MYHCLWHQLVLVKLNINLISLNVLVKVKLEEMCVCLQLERAEISTACLKVFFEGKPAVDQFLCRALVCQGRLKAPPATGSVVRRTVNYSVNISLSVSVPHQSRC